MFDKVKIILYYYIIERGGFRVILTGIWAILFLIFMFIVYPAVICLLMIWLINFSNF